MLLVYPSPEIIIEIAEPSVLASPSVLGFEGRTPMQISAPTEICLQVIPTPSGLSPRDECLRVVRLE